MLPTETHQLFSAEAENELVEEIITEIKEREQSADEVCRRPTDIPGDTLVFLAGELSLSASQHAVTVYQQSLWPLIRDRISHPDHLIFGTYDHAIDRTRAICQVLETKSHEDEFKLAAAQTPDRKPTPRFPEDSLTIDHPDIPEYLYSLFLMRLDAGFFLSGIETLWPQTAPSLIRTLYNQSHLAEWDRILEQNIPLFTDHASVVRRLLDDTPARMDSMHFSVLLNLAKTDPYPGLTLVNAPRENGVDHHSARPWHWYAVDDYFKLFFPEKMESGDITIRLDPATHTLKTVLADQSWFQVVFSDESREQVEIIYPELPEPSDTFKGFLLFDVVLRQTGIHMDDEDTLLIRFAGRISKEMAARFHDDPVPGAVMHVDKAAASPTFP
jgi:hypothetical protein